MSIATIRTQTSLLVLLLSMTALPAGIAPLRDWRLVPRKVVLSDGSPALDSWTTGGTPVWATDVTNDTWVAIQLPPSDAHHLLFAFKVNKIEYRRDDVMDAQFHTSSNSTDGIDGTWQRRGELDVGVQTVVAEGSDNDSSLEIADDMLQKFEWDRGQETWIKLTFSHSQAPFPIELLWLNLFEITPGERHDY